MLTLFGSGYASDCEGLSRREFMKIGALGLGSLSLPELLAARASAAAGGEAVRDKAVVMLFLQGGPTHIETFDPKMTAPVEYRSMFGEVATALPGVTFGGTFPKLAALADKVSVVRSFRHGNGSHATASKLVASGGNPTQANMGSLYARLAGANNPRTGMPSNTMLFPGSVGEQYKNLYRQADRIGDVGDLGTAYRAFDPSAGGQVVDNMKLKVSRDRLDDRRALLNSLDRLRRAVDVSEALAGADEATAASLRRGHGRRFAGLRSLRGRPADIGHVRHRQVHNSQGRAPQEAQHHAEVLADRVGKTDAAGPAAVRSRLRVCDRIEFRLGHARQRLRHRRRDGLSGAGGRSGRFGVHSGRSSARLERQNLVDCHRRIRTHAEDQQESRPRSLGQSLPVDVLRRRFADGPGDRRLRPPRFGPGNRAGDDLEPAGHGDAHPVRRRSVARGARRADEHSTRG